MEIQPGGALGAVPAGSTELAGLRLEELADALPSIVYAVTSDGRTCYVNRRWREYTGAEVNVASEGRRFVHPDDLERLRVRWHKAVTSGEPFEAEYRLRRADGTYRWHLARANRLSDPIGPNGLWVGTLTDIDRQKDIEDVLDRREREFRTLAQNAPDIITRVDRSLRHTYANRAIEAAFGIPPGDYLGYTLEEMRLDQTLVETWAAAVAAAFEQGEEQEQEVAVERPAGPRYYILRAVPEADRSGCTESVLSIVYDITQRRTALAALRSSEERFRQLAANTDDVFWIADLRSRRLLYVSPAYERVWMQPISMLYDDPRAWSAALLEEDRGQLEELFFETSTSEAPAAFSDKEYRIRRNDGTTVWIRDRRFAIAYEGGEPLRVGGIAEDITERKRREIEREELLSRERAARTEAEGLARSKDEFLATVSHELRSPLNAIRGWAHVLKQTSEDPRLVARAVDAIERNAQAQVRLIDDLLDAARIMQGKLLLAPRPVRLQSLVESSIETHRPAMLAKHISVNVAHDPSCEIVEVDPERLQQVLANILSNAVKFTGEGGSIDVRTCCVDGFFELGVRDNGIGISPAFLPHVFERFHQADGSSTRRQGGLGLGLALTRHLIELHGGTISVDSAGEGRGSTFLIKLPVFHSASASSRDPAPGRRTPPNAGLLAATRILIVDDDQDSREMLRVLLEDAGASVQVFDTAAAALAHIKSAGSSTERPHVVVSDIAMPGEDGYSFVAKLRDWQEREARQVFKPEDRIAAVAVTAFARAENRERALAAGFDAHFAKPIDPVQLISLLARMAARQPINA